MSDDKTYNGWTNYETWCVHLWLTNEEGSYNYWIGRGEEALEQAKENDPDDPEEQAGLDLAEELKGEINDAADNIEGIRGTMFSDLLSAALSEVNWYEVAKAFLPEEETP